MKKEGNLRRIMIIVLGIIVGVLYITAFMLFDFYFIPMKQSIYYDDGLWAFIRQELQEFGTIRAIFTKW